MKDKVIAIDEKDAQVWQLITDVPKLKAPWQYICFVLNVIIPGKLRMNLTWFRQRHNDSELLLRKVE